MQIYCIENKILARVQQDAFTLQLQNVKITASNCKAQKILNLSPILINKLIKGGSGIRHSNTLKQNNHRVILSRDHQVLSIVLTQFHEKYHHCGEDQTLPSIRKEFWIVNGKSVI